MRITRSEQLLITVLLWLAVFLGMLAAFVFAELTYAGTVPDNARKYAPMLRDAFVSVWPDYDTKHDMAGQIEKETCITLKHKKCWSPTAELKTSREYGFGLGQITVAYGADGTERFNVFKEIKALDPVLAGWAWEDRYNPELQIRALIRKNLVLYKQFAGFKGIERKAVMFSAYNGGAGGVLKDRRLCMTSEGCDPSKWFDNIELHSTKAKVAVKGYGKSFYEINREYVRSIMFERNQKYIQFFQCQYCHTDRYI